MLMKEFLEKNYFKYPFFNINEDKINHLNQLKLPVFIYNVKNI